MKRLGLVWHSPWALLFTVVVLVAGPVLLYWFLPATGVPTAIALGMIAVIVIKHLGVLAICWPRCTH
jgi:hypothetical protein